jgi:DNA-binding Lrp family transcriptional regulator
MSSLRKDMQLKKTSPRGSHPGRYRQFRTDEMKTKLDVIDIRILEELQRDSGRPLHDLSRLLGISLAACARRVKRLETENVIQCYVAILNPEMLGLNLDVFLNFRLRRHSRKAKRSIHDRLRAMPEVVECHSLTGDWDFLLHIRISGVKEFNSWIDNNIMDFPFLLTTHSSISLERIKYSTELPLRHALPHTAGKHKTLETSQTVPRAKLSQKGPKERIASLEFLPKFSRTAKRLKKA